MTLCLAWRKGKEVFYASDSRLTEQYQNRQDGSIEYNRLTDIAIKIMKINVKIDGPITCEGNSEIPSPKLYNSTYGVCYCGGQMMANLIANTLDEVLSSLQCFQLTNINIEKIADIAFKIYKTVTTEVLRDYQDPNATCKMLFSGHCPQTGTFKSYCFSYDCKKNECKFEIIDLKETPYYIGDSIAIDKAHELESNLSDVYTPIHLLRDIIKDPDYETVGGGIQIGRFSNKDFETLGITYATREYDEYNNPNLEDHYVYRGIQFNLKDFDGINITKMFLLAFEKERNNLSKEIRDELDSTI